MLEAPDGALPAMRRRLPSLRTAVPADDGSGLRGKRDWSWNGGPLSGLWTERIRSVTASLKHVMNNSGGNNAIRNEVVDFSASGSGIGWLRYGYHIPEGRFQKCDANGDDGR
jgi:hypothetical protein